MRGFGAARAAAAIALGRELDGLTFTIEHGAVVANWPDSMNCSDVERDLVAETIKAHLPARLRNHEVIIT